MGDTPHCLLATAMKHRVQEEAVCVWVCVLTSEKERDKGRKEGLASCIHVSVCLCVCCEGLNESQCAHMGHHKQTMKNESGEAVLRVSLWEQLQTGVRTFGDNRFVCVCLCVCACASTCKCPAGLPFRSADISSSARVSVLPLERN